MSRKGHKNANNFWIPVDSSENKSVLNAAYSTVAVILCADCCNN